MQRPPIYSAVRVQGRKAYERARDGEEFEVPEREVTVYRFEQLWREDDRAEFLIECSAGTYVRSLIAELGDGYCEELRRTRIGPFDVAGRRSAARPAARAGARLPAARRARRRRRVARRPRPDDLSPAEAEGEHVLLVDADGPIAIAEPREDGLLKPVVGFRG